MIGTETQVPLSANLEKPIQNAANRRGWAIAAAGFVIVCMLGWLAFEIPKGVLWNTDELLTAERSREMLLTEPWTIHFNFQLSFEKPPLQYWLTTLTLPRFANRTLAVRVWPLVYGGLTAIAIGWLAFLLDSTRPWRVPLSVAVLASCPLFSTESSRALLDMGLTFFTTAAIIFAQLARKRPAWWLGVAVVCWLGALQKFPLVLLVWLLIVLVRLCSRSERRTLRSGWLITGIGLAIVAMAIWPLIQIVKYGMPVASVFHEEIVVWLGPEHLGARPYLEIPFRLSTDGGVCGLFALIAPFVLLFWRRRDSEAPVAEISIVCLAVIGLAVVSNFRSVRYIIPIIPSLCLLLALVLHRFLEQRRVVRARTLAFLIVFLSAGFVQAEITLYYRQRDVSDEKRMAEKLGTLQQEGTHMVLIKAVTGGGDLLYDSFYLFHGNLRFPVGKYAVDEIRQAPPRPPVIGICVARDFPVVQEVYPNVQVQLTRHQFVCWRVDTP